MAGCQTGDPDKDTNFGVKAKLAVNAAIVTDNEEQFCGSLVTFDDVSQIEEKNFELSHLVEKLPVYLVLDDLVGLKGALQLARQAAVAE